VRVLVVDGANVVGSRPDGWWRDRPGAAQRLWQRLVDADLAYDEVVLVLEGAARRGVPDGSDGAVVTVHAPGSGDDTIVEVAAERASAGQEVSVVTADRALSARLAGVGARTTGPSWLLGRLAQ
jgi:predicted RNA-binding protein with PIN domain